MSVSNVPYVNEENVRKHLSAKVALDAVEAVFADMSDQSAVNFPIIREDVPGKNAVFGVKAGCNESRGWLGLKAGGYWLDNAVAELPNHQSTVFLLNPDSGQPKALVAGNHLTAIRTAAAAAVSIKHLARTDSKTLGIVGAGEQAEFQIRAAMGVRPFEKVLIWNRTQSRAEELAGRLADIDAIVSVLDCEVVAGQSDVLITVVNSHAPVVMAGWIQPGTHIAAMGTDAQGKQELDASIADSAKCFTDDVTQAITIGELQHPHRLGTVNAGSIVPLGDVVRGKASGRIQESDITLYDGTGVGLQDLAVAALILERATF